MTHPPSTPEHRLAKLGLTLPPTPTPVATYVTYVQEGSLLFVSGQGPRKHDGSLHTGKVGADVTVAEAYRHAELTGLNLLSVAKAALGDLSRIARVVKVLGMVNAVPDFGDHPEVINGCSDLFRIVFGENGLHARSAIGVGSLPRNITVEIEVIFAVHGAASYA